MFLHFQFLILIRLLCFIWNLFFFFSKSAILCFFAFTAEKKKQHKMATEFLHNEMGQMVNRASRDKIPINLSKEEIQLYIRRFQIIDKDRKGYVSINDIRRSLKVSYISTTLKTVKHHTLLRSSHCNYFNSVTRHETRRRWNSHLTLRHWCFIQWPTGTGWLFTGEPLNSFNIFYYISARGRERSAGRTTTRNFKRNRHQYERAGWTWRVSTGSILWILWTYPPDFVIFAFE